MSALYYGQYGQSSFANGESSEIEVTITWNPATDDSAKVVDFLGKRFSNGETQKFQVPQVENIGDRQPNFNLTYSNDSISVVDTNNDPFSGRTQEERDMIQFNTPNRTVKVIRVPGNDIEIYGKTFRAEE